MAAFIGGDWEHKGLRHMIEALALAPGWHLAVAGRGQPGDYRQLAARLGVGRADQLARRAQRRASRLRGGGRVRAAVEL